MNQEINSCGLCERPPFAEQAQPLIYSCSLCFQLLKANSSLKIKDMVTNDKLIFTEAQVSEVDSLDNIQSNKNNSNQKITQLLACIRKSKSKVNNLPKNIYCLINQIYSNEIQRILIVWKEMVLQINTIIQNNVKKPLISVKENSIKSADVTPIKTQTFKSLSNSIQDKLCQIIENINNLNPKTMLSQNFILATEIQTITLKNIECSKRSSIINRVHFSHHVSKQNSKDQLSKFIPSLQLSKKNLHKNVASVISSGITPKIRMKTQANSRKTQIQWLLQNQDHNPQGFRQKTGNNTSRRMTTQPMTQCIEQALKFTSVSNNTLSLVNFNVSKIAFDCYLNMTQWNNSINTIKLVKTGLLDHQFNLLLCFAARHGNLKNIVVTNNQLTEQSLQMLLNFVKKIKQIQKVYMGNNKIKVLHTKQIVKQIMAHGIECLYI